MSIDLSEIGSLTGHIIEGIGIFVIVTGFLIAALVELKQYFSGSDDDLQNDFRRRIKRNMLLGLDFLVAGDIIRTVTVEPSLESIASLGLLVLVRTVLVFTIHLELEGHWPWQHRSR